MNHPDPRRRYILAAAQLIKELGEENVSARKIAAVLGTAPSAIYRHFQTLDELMAYAAISYRYDTYAEMDRIAVDASNAFEMYEKTEREFARFAFARPKLLDCLVFGAYSQNMSELMARVVSEQAHIGIAFDGDADRMLAVDEKGHLVDGDQIMAICGKYMKDRGRLKDNTIVATVMSNLGLALMCKEHGIHLETTKVGDRYVLEHMLHKGYNIGGEQSGHIIFLDDNTTGDGLLSALRLLQVMVETGKPLSELASIMEVLPQALVNAKVPNHKKDNFMEYGEIAEAIAKLDEKFAGEGRVLIRPSGTESLVRVMIEGKNQAMIEEDAKNLADLIMRVML